MSPWTDPGLDGLTSRLAPYARASFERAAALAARLHAEEISPEHWLAALLADEDCAATRAVLHAFADPETLGVEVLALCAGIMVVGSKRTLPFSVRAVEALQAARAEASAEARPAVEPCDLFRAALTRLAPDLRTRFERLPGVVLALPPAAPSGPSPDAVSPNGALFRHFSTQALRALGASARGAASLERAAIGPAHLVFGTLEVDEGLRLLTNLTTARARLVCTGLDEDDTPLPTRHLPAEARLQALLAGLADGSETLDVLADMLALGSEELNALLRRQKVTVALIERCHGVYRDPEG